MEVYPFRYYIDVSMPAENMTNKTTCLNLRKLIDCIDRDLFELIKINDQIDAKNQEESVD